MAQQIQLRHGTASEWTTANPILASGEAGVETDTSKVKYGNGATAWNSLPYASGGGAGSVTSIDVSGGATGLTSSGGPVTASGTITLAGTLALSHGGTGATTQTGAANAVLPTQASQSGKFLTTDGTNASWVAATGSGTLTNISINTANGFAGLITSPTTTPAITVNTTVTGIVKGNGTAISAATSGTDYSAGTSGLSTGILKSTTTTGALTIAIGSDFPVLNQNTTGTSANVTGIVNIPNGGTNLSALGSPSQLLGVNVGGSALEYKTVGAGAGITATLGAGTLTITNTGVTSVAGTASVLTASAATGDITLNLANYGTAGTYGYVVTDIYGRVTSGIAINPVAYGGTGTNTAPTAGQVLVGTSGNIYAPTTISSGTGINVTSGSGSLSIANSGVTSAVAGANISVSGPTGAVTISVTGTVPAASTATNLSGGAGGSIPYQSNASVTSFLIEGTSSQVLISGNTPSWTNTPTLTGTNFTGIPNSGLTNNTVTIGSTSVALGSTHTSLAGMTGISFTSGTVTGLASPAASSDAATKAYVDAAGSAITIHAASNAATTVNLTATYANGALGVGATLTATTNVALPLIDSYSALVNDRILVKNQGTSTQNGIYVVTSLGSVGVSPWILTRASDFDNSTAGQVKSGALTFIQSGTTLAATSWSELATGTGIGNVIIIGTDNITFTQYAGAAAYVAGSGLSLVGNTFSITAPVSPALGGNGGTVAPTTGQVLVGTSSNVYAPTTIGTSTGISVTAGSGSLSIGNTGVTSAVGTGGNITVSAATGAVTFNLATAGTSGTYGSVTTDTFGRVTAGTVATPIANGGTNLTTLGTASQILGVNTGATALEYKTVTAGTGISVTPTAGVLTIANTGVTSVGVSGGSTGLTTAGGPITTSGTITLSGTLVVANGGTGVATATAYAPIFGGTTGTGAFQSGTVGTTGQFLTSNGAGALPTFQTLTGTGSGSVVFGTAPTISAATLTGIVTTNGANVTTANALGGTVIDVTKGLNTVSIAVNTTFTFSGTPATANTWFGTYITNTDTNPHTITIPSSFSIGKQATITTFVIPASGQAWVVWRYNGATYVVYGDTPALNNFIATTSPVVGSDVTLGYGIGSFWLNTTSGVLYVAESVSTGAAVWVAAGGGGSGTVTSVAVSGGTTGLTTSGGPITTSGTVTLAGTLVVANGGTGVATLTAYAPMFGGTTGTGAVQSGTVGTTGQVLTSNGAGALPTFQTPSSFNPATVENVAGTTYTFIAADQGKIKRFTNGSGCSATIPNGLGTGWNCLWERSSAAGNLTFVASSTTLAAANGSGSLVASVGLSGAIVPEAVDVYQISGALGAASGSGTVTTVSVVSTNGFTGTVANATTTPAITLTTSITGVLKGNGTAISAATSGTDYSAGTNALATGMLKSTTTTGALSIGVAGTDYSAGTNGLSTGILKSTTTTGALTIAVAGDFPTLNQNTTGTAANVTGVVAVANGGTNLSSGTSGGVLAFTASGTIASSAALTSNAIVLGGGAGAAPKVVAGITTDGTSVLTLGVAGTSVGGVAFNNATSGSITLQPVTGALGSITLLLPATTSTLATLNQNQYVQSQAVVPVTLASGASIAVNALLSNNFILVLGINATLANPTNLVSGQTLNIRVAQDGTGSRTLAYGSLYKWSGGTAPTLSTAANAVDFISCYYDGTLGILLCSIVKDIR